MSVVLISPYPDLTAFGLRTLSACLRQAGIGVRMIFLPDPRPRTAPPDRSAIPRRSFPSLPRCAPMPGLSA